MPLNLLTESKWAFAWHQKCMLLLLFSIMVLHYPVCLPYHQAAFSYSSFAILWTFFKMHQSVFILLRGANMCHQTWYCLLPVVVEVWKPSMLSKCQLWWWFHLCLIEFKTIGWKWPISFYSALCFSMIYGDHFKQKSSPSLTVSCSVFKPTYTLSLLKNDCDDVSAYARGRHLLSYSHLCVFSHAFKRKHRDWIDA